MDAQQNDFLCHYRGGMSFKLSAKRAQCSTTQIKAWAVADPEFAGAMQQIHEERIFEARRALIEALPDIVAAMIANAKGSNGTSVQAARLVFQAAGVRLPEVGKPKLERKEQAQPSKGEEPPGPEEELGDDDLNELQDIARGIL